MSPIILTTQRLRQEPFCDAHWELLERLGMTYEGVQHWYDSELLAYSMTRDEYQALV